MAEGRKPTHVAFAVAGDGPNLTGTRIGEAWPDETGGFDIVLSPGRTVAGRIVLREPAPQDNLEDDGSRSVAEARRLVAAVGALIDRSSWPRLRKDEFIRAVEALAEAQLVAEVAIGMPGDAEARQRFAAAFLLFAKR